MDLPIVAEIRGRDRLEVTSLKPFNMKIIGCEQLFNDLKEFKNQYGSDLSLWPLPKGRSHTQLLIKELILKLKDQWKHVYDHEEVCHCRNVSLESVEQALFLGAETSEMISKWTMSSSACGTCRPDVEKIIEFRLKV